MSRIGFVGTGAIAAPMVRFLARKGHDIVVTERGAEFSGALDAEFHNVRVADNQSVVDSVDIVFLSLRPHIWGDVVPGLRFHPHQQIVSVMAGVPLQDLRDACLPATQLSVTIPLAFLEQGGCPLPVYPADSPLVELFAPENPVLPVTSEAALTAHFTATTLLSAVLSVMMEGSGWLASETGDPVSAEIYVASLVAGFLRDVPQDGGARLAEARDGLATQGTLALQMVEGLESAGVPRHLQTTLIRIADSMKVNP